jgi:hypothetical protein
MTRLKITDELTNQICAGVRQGGFVHIAAQAFGVPKETFDKWMAQGEKKDRPKPIYVKFAKAIRQAEAVARLTAEINAHEKDPRLWLRSGPGKEREGSPGWTTIVRPQVQGGNTINLFTSPDFIAFMSMLRTVLAPFPEALKALTDALEKPEPKVVEMVANPSNQ